MDTAYSGITFHGNDEVQIFDWADSAECSAFNSRKGEINKFTFQVKFNFYERLVKYLPDETLFGVQPPITVLRDVLSCPLRVFTRVDTNLSQRRRIPRSYYFHIEDWPNGILEAVLYALAETCRELLWLRSFLGELNVSIIYDTIFQDNTTTISRIKLDGMSERSKHIDVNFNFVKRLVKDELVVCQQ